MTDVILTITFWVCALVVVVLFILECIREYRVRTGDIDPSTIPSVYVTKRWLIIMLLVLFMNVDYL